MNLEIKSVVEAKKLSEVFNALFSGYCPNDDTLLEKLRTWLETSLNNAGIVDNVLAVSTRTTKSRECPYVILLPFRL